MSRPGRKARLIAAIAAGLVVVGGGVIIALTRGASAPATSAGGQSASGLPSAGASAAVQFTTSAGTILAAGLTSSKDADVRAVLVSPPATIPAKTLAGLAALRSITFDTEALKASSENDASVPATVVDRAGRSERWLVYLQRVDGAWKILGTEVLR